MSDEHDWEYYEEAEREQAERESRQRFAFMPLLCQKCRWLDWYYTEDCTQRAIIGINGYCSLFLRDPLPFKPTRVWLFYIQVQYLLFAIYNACMVGIAEVEPTLRRHYAR